MLASSLKPITCPITVGRAAYLDVLQEQIIAARRGQGSTILLAGEAGIGKSRLAAEAAKLADEAGFAVLQGVCFEADRALPYAPLIDLVQRFFVAYPLASWSNEHARDTRELVTLLPELASQWPDLAPVSTDHRPHEQRRLFQALLHYFTTLAPSASGRPAQLVMIEDLHWSDDNSLDFILHLARRIRNQPMLVILTYRNDEMQAALQHCLALLARERLAIELLLQRLTPSEVGAMIHAILPAKTAVTSEFVGALHTLTDGNPFFVEEVIQALVTSDFAESQPTPWTSRPLADVRIPRTVQDAVQRRMAQLSAAARAVLTIAAIIGQRFDFVLLATVTRHREEELVRLLRELVDAQLVVEAAADHFVFRHALTHKAIYDQMLARERRPLHRLIAETLEQAAPTPSPALVASLANHFYAAGAWEKTLHYARQAGERADQLYAARAAIGHYSHALEAADHLAAAASAPPTGIMAALFRSRGKAYDLLGEFLAARDDYVRALALAHEQGDLSSEWQSLLDLGFLHSGRDYEQADHYLQRALALARQLDDPTALGHTLNRVGNWQLMAGDQAEGVRCHHEALAIFQATGDKRNLATTYDLLGAMFMLTADCVAAAQNYEQAIALLREVDDRWTLSSALAMQACSGGHLICEAIVNQPRSLAACLHMGDEAMTLARQLDAPPAEAFACIQHAVTAAAHGEYERALRAGERALAIATDQESAQFLAGAARALGALHCVFLEYDQARRVFAAGLPAARTTGSSLLLGAVGGGLAETLIVLGELDQARVLLDSIALNDPALRQIGERSAWVARVELYLAAGDTQAALQLIGRLIDAAPNVAQGGVIPRLWQLHAQCLVALEQFDAAERLLQRARDRAQAETLLPRLWPILLDMGKLYHRQGKLPEAQDHYKAAQAVIDTLALKIGDDSGRRQFLARAGALIPQLAPPAPAQVQKAAFGGLTKREREVAMLIARGLTNRAIADQLVVSERTVEKHVENVMGKLGFSVRTQVAVWAVEKGLPTAN